MNLLFESSYSHAGVSSVSLSQQASRFWIPFDVKLFESKEFS
jgi:hypothetical protein